MYEARPEQRPGFLFSGCRSAVLKDALEHVEDESLLGLGEAAEAFELALEAGRRAALGGGLGARDTQEFVGRHREQLRELGDEGDREAEAADFVMREGLLGDAQLFRHGLLGEARLLAELRDALWFVRNCDVPPALPSRM